MCNEGDEEGDGKCFFVFFDQKIETYPFLFNRQSFMVILLPLHLLIKILQDLMGSYYRSRQRKETSG